MTKKLLGLLVVALFCISTMSASTLSCNQTTGGTNGNPATFPPAQNVLAGVTFVCNAPTVPGGDTLNSVSVTIIDSFSGGIQGQTNTVDFTYTLNGFSGVTGLTTSSSSNPGSGEQGVATDLGGMTAENPASPVQCTTTSNTLVTCTELSPTAVSFSIVGSSTWAAGGMGNGGSDGMNVLGSYTYSPTVTTPEPASLMMIGGGLVGLALLARRKRKV
jgi:hypothetical protein